MARSAPGLLLALIPVACTCSEPSPTDSGPAAAPAEQEPHLPPWTGPSVSALPLGALPAAFQSPTELGLLGDVVFRNRSDLLQPGVELPSPRAVEYATLELSTGPEHTDARLRWRLASTPPTEISSAPAPSWNALCSDASACFRTGPWPDAAGWLAQLPPMKLSAVSPEALVDLGGSTWPHVLAQGILDIRGTLPKPAAGLFDSALSALGEVEFAGGRLEADGTFLAYVRLPTPWVNFTSTALAYAGQAPVPTVLSDGTEVSWSALPGGGVVLALDDGVEPAMGWIVFASSAERFTWLATAPRTQAGPSAFALRVETLGSLREHAPPSTQTWIDAYAQQPFVFHLGSEDGLLTARIIVGPRLP